MNIMMDGPLDFDIDGDYVVIRGTSDGERRTFSLKIADALVSRHRFNAAYDDAMARPADANVVYFPLPRHAADSA